MGKEVDYEQLVEQILLSGMAVTSVDIPGQGGRPFKLHKCVGHGHTINFEDRSIKGERFYVITMIDGHVLCNDKNVAAPVVVWDFRYGLHPQVESQLVAVYKSIWPDKDLPWVPSEEEMLANYINKMRLSAPSEKM